jgi:transposase-like protein
VASSVVLEFQAELPRFGSMMNERGIRLVHTTMLRWVQHLYAGIREAVEAVRSPGGRLLADG